MSLPPEVRRITGIASNQYLIVEPDGLTLIDAGLPGGHRKILRLITHLGRRPQDLRRILVTHADGDHYGSLNELRQASGARVHASAVEADAIRHGTSSRQLHPAGLQKIFFAVAGRLVRAQPAPVDEILKPGDRLPILGGLEILDTAGHTPEHVSFYSPSTGILFAGDSITVHSRELSPSQGGNTWDGEQARRSFAAQIALRPSIVCAGHGYWEATAAS